MTPNELHKQLRDKGIHIQVTVNPYSDSGLYGYKIYEDHVITGVRCIAANEELNTSYEKALSAGFFKVASLQSKNNQGEIK